MRKPKPEGFSDHLKARKGIPRKPCSKPFPPRQPQSEITKMRKSIAMKDKCNKPILCIETGIIFKSITEASRIFNTSGIPNCLRNISKTAAGYHWALCEDKDRIEQLKEFENKPPINYIEDILSKKIICIETQQIFNSIVEAKQWLGKGDIPSCVKGKQITAGGYHWCYLDYFDNYQIRVDKRIKSGKYVRERADKEESK